MPDFTINVVDGVRVGPDDLLAVSLPASTSREQLEEMIVALKGHPLEGRVTFIVGAESLAVVTKCE